MTAASALIGPGPHNVYVWLSYSSYSQQGNYSTWYREMVYRQGGSSYWAADATSHGSYTDWAGGGPYHFGIPGSWAYSYNEKGLDVSTFTKAHNDRGYLAAGTLVGSILVAAFNQHGSAGVGSGTPPRIPKAPTQPSAPVFVSAETNSLKFKVSEPADMGGSNRTTVNFEAKNKDTGAITAWSANTLTPTSPTTLEPNTQYEVKHRIVNGIGSSPWSPVTTMTTESGFFVSDGSSWKGASPQVSDGVKWLRADTFISNGTAWAKPAP